MASKIQVPGETVTETETVTISKAQFAELQARAANGDRVTPKNANKIDNLPDQSEFDAKTITSPVLTKQGWLVPDKKA